MKNFFLGRVFLNKKGFTMIELILIILFLGILIGIGFQRIGAVTESAEKSVVGADHRIIVSAIQMAQMKNEGDLADENDINEFLEKDFSEMSQDFKGTHEITIEENRLRSWHNAENFDNAREEAKWEYIWD